MKRAALSLKKPIGLSNRLGPFLGKFIKINLARVLFNEFFELFSNFMLKDLVLFFYTLRFLKPIQLYWRVYLKLVGRRSFFLNKNEEIHTRHLELIPPIPKHDSLIGEQFFFLNQNMSISFPINWNAPEKSKLWLYNLHYFDFLNQKNNDSALGLQLMKDWVQQNNIIGTGNGWEPYPLSLRIVNWIKFFDRIGRTDEIEQLQSSLFLQTRVLADRLEYHLLGNHLFKNAVALIFSGSYFEGEEAKKWIKKGLQIFIGQVREQILKDGGHFERSPMYHVLISEDILDCLNLNLSRQFFSITEEQYIRRKIVDMLNVLADIVHQDGDIPFFNDSALRIAPSPKEIFRYAESLGIKTVQFDHVSKNRSLINIYEKPDFGLFIFENRKSKCIFDAGMIGPDHLPGHAHCDTLSYELSISGHRCIVNSGTYQYAGTLRNLFRATSAHNTVRVDSKEQHEIWSTFRVARRGYPFNLQIFRSNNYGSIAASHSGYTRLAGKIVHRREIVCRDDSWVVTDCLEGRGMHQADNYIHFHPDVQIISKSSSEVKCSLYDVAFSLKVLEGESIDWEEGLYSPEFGVSEINQVLVLRKKSLCPIKFSYQITIH